MTVCHAFDVIIEYYHQLGIKEFVYKPVPSIYAKVPSDEDLYALFLHSAQLDVVNIASTISLASYETDTCEDGYNENTRRNIRRARKEGVTIVQSDDLATFHDILSSLLKSRFSTTPVHTLAELQLLAGQFPDNIRLLLAMKGGEAVAGSLLYITDTVVHTQYIAATEEGKRCNALSLLFDHAISEARTLGKRYFDFGTCNENRGLYLNEGLIRQKNGFGGRGIAYPSYVIKIG
jgi:lipid II:glycine glycyltransferase (peptidoglycan interpeptide bridge formation enzyme)